jgi:RND family efflux transporter MFP subunit
MRFPFGKKNGNSEGARKRGTELIRKHKRLFALAFVMIIGAGIGIHARMKTNASNTEPVMNTETVQKQDLRKSITLNGTIASMEKATLTSELTDTYIKQLTIKVGDHVTKGQVLAVLDTTSLEKQLKVAKMALETSKSKGEMSIVAANRSLDNAEQSMQSQASQGAQELQNTTDKMNQNNVDLQNAQLDIASYVTKEAELQAEIDKAKDMYDSEQRALRQKERKLARKQNGEDDGDESSSRLQLDITDLTNAQSDRQNHISDLKEKLSDIQGKRKEAESTLKTAQDNVKNYQLEISKSQNTINDQNRSNQKSVNDSKSDVVTAKLDAENSILSAQNDVEKLQDQIKKATIVAPFDGIVTSVEVKEGDNYKGDVIAVVQDTSGFKVTAAVDQYDVSDVSKDMNAVVTTKTTGDKEMQGTLTFVSPVPAMETSTVDNKTTTTNSGTYPVEVTLKDPSDRLRIGMAAKLTIIEKEKKNVLSLPGNVIQMKNDTDGTVTVISPDGTEKEVAVKIGMKTDYYVEVISDTLKEGDQVRVVSDDTDLSSLETMGGLG